MKKLLALGLMFSCLSLAGASELVAESPDQSTPVPEQAPTPHAATSGEYAIGANDVLRITVFNEDKLSGLFRVDTDGTITYPMLGRLQVAGHTPRAIEAIVTKMLEDGYVRRPTVAVEVQEFRSRTIFILGQVRNAGKYPLQSDLNVVEALSMAGSLTPEASKEIRVIRPRHEQARTTATLPDATGDAEVLRVDLNAIEEGHIAANIALQDGDTIYVPDAERFFISGHVRTPGSYVLERGMTIQQAIAVAGGLTERGSNRRIKIKREDPKRPGTFVEVSVQLSDRIQPGDTIIVPQRLI
jgi:polysaccharide biosynthesis/export protein